MELLYYCTAKEVIDMYNTVVYFIIKESSTLCINIRCTMQNRKGVYNETMLSRGCLFVTAVKIGVKIKKHLQAVTIYIYHHEHYYHLLNVPQL